MIFLPERAWGGFGQRQRSIFASGFRLGYGRGCRLGRSGTTLKPGNRGLQLAPMTKQPQPRQRPVLVSGR